MDCVVCKNGHTAPGFATVTLQREACTIVIKAVPAEVCENCGEYYLTDEMTKAVLERAESAVELGAEVEIIRFAA